MSDQEEVSLGELHELTGQELGRRLKDEQARKDLPATALVQAYLATSKAMDREKDREKPDEVEAPDVLESVAGLPPERQKQILLFEQRRLQVKSEAISAYIASLKEK